jgi:hypothetical protein
MSAKQISIGPGPGRAKQIHGPGLGRAALKIDRAGRATTLAGPRRAGPGHKNEARFEPW